jgi:asparagine synthase (glutamine-hydrolysing)
VCGIWSSVGFAPEPQRLEIVAHRGPDGDGWRVFESSCGPVVLGHRRLAIIDISDSGAQPMSYADGRYWITYNGEIYNYLELRRELEQRGWSFRTHSDTEVLLAAYATWGEASLDRLLGMFALVIWDSVLQQLFVARDRFGIKPLYYFASSGGIAFASEIKQLCGLPGYVQRMNLRRVYDFLTAGITEHTDETLFAGVNQLRGGECTRIDLAQWRPGEAITIRRWYAILAPGALELSEAEAGERFCELLTDAVRLHLRSDVPIGSCLSGGLDSSSIVCLMSRMLEPASTAQLNCVSACYSERPFDERPFMEEVIRATQAQPHYVYPRLGDAFDLAERITWHQDEPYGSTSIFAQWCVFKAAHDARIKVMLDGQGADEQLAGYHASFGFYFASLVRRRRWLTLLRAMLQRRSYHGVSLRSQAWSLVGPMLPSRFAHRLRRVRQSLSEGDWYDSPAFRVLDLSLGAFDMALKHNGLGPVHSIGALCVALTQASNLGMLLHWEDRNSMAHSVEARVPFLDHRLVEFTIGLGDDHKIVHGDTKRVLRRGMARVLPQAVLNRRDKLGFSTPEEEWFRGPLRKLVVEGVEETLRRYAGLLNPAGTRRLMNDMLDGRRAVDFTLWRIINLGIWGRVFGLSV